MISERRSKTLIAACASKNQGRVSVRAEAQHAEAPRGLVIGEAATPGQAGARFVRAILLAG
eukprot:CAMPEP_0174722508 /NCGR_PEP_ID=MMETSP1094-20130205/38642_1 /TAXON_ID=156173 /ORGANISM="Chrysochromulina brevifilum, Strain UTEX LB 985" /LENGTH=60 /DNA_ID=CAMNT_0015923383 /DNA_START=413 /DNA_END=592 /DNA_ORIENTATION=-